MEPDVPAEQPPAPPAPEQPSVEQTAPETAPEPPAEPEPPAKAYEPGPVSLDEYTCDDCVYVDTCPKKGESSPADCGLFQWRS